MERGWAGEANEKRLKTGLQCPAKKQNKIPVGLCDLWISRVPLDLLLTECCGFQLSQVLSERPADSDLLG